MIQWIAWFAVGMFLFGWLMALTLTAIDASATTRRDRDAVYGELNKIKRDQRARTPWAGPRVEIVTVPHLQGGAAMALAPPPKPRLVDVTRDDDLVHTRETVPTPRSETIPAPPPEFAEARESSDDPTEVMLRPPKSLLTSLAGLRFPPRQKRISG